MGITAALVYECTQFALVNHAAVNKDNCLSELLQNLEEHAVSPIYDKYLVRLIQNNQVASLFTKTQPFLYLSEAENVSSSQQPDNK